MRTSCLRWSLPLIPVFALLGLQACGPAPAPEPFDLVIRGGRVMDPESGRDEIADVGVRGGRVEAIAPNLGPGDREFDASGLVVAPGFIDILGSVPPVRHAHLHKATDGVTTSLGMHGGPLEPSEYARRYEESGALVNYAAAVGDRRLREAAGVTDRDSPATPEQILIMQQLAEKAIQEGAVGIGFGINYAPGTSYEEVFTLFEVGARNGVPSHLHARHKGNIFPLTMSLAAEEVIAVAAATGSQAQLAHLSSSTVGSMPLCIKLIEGASRHGVDVGFDFHVWTRNETSLQSALYEPGWQERFGGIDYKDIYVSDTQEQLTEARFNELRSQPGNLSVQTEFISEEEIEMAISSPMGIISSDSGGLWSEDGHEKETGHPRGTGTFSRFLGRYVRDRQVIPLMEGLKRITLLPAQRMEKAIPQMKQKGRLQVGSDADITVFDPATIRERATYQQPYLFSEGIRYVLVNGVPVVENGEPKEDVSAGRWLRHPGSQTGN